MKSKKPFDHHKEHICRVWFDEKGYQTATEIVSDLIRCKDCKWFGDIGCAIRIVDDTDKPSENDYCSFAERKEEKNEKRD